MKLSVDDIKHARRSLRLIREIGQL
jgi:hypothetical protein